MANQALAYFYPRVWPQPGADLVDEPAAAAPNPQNAAVPALDGFQLELNHVLVDARARRKHATKVWVVAALQLFTALAILCVFRLVPGVKDSYFRKDITASDPKDNHGQQHAPFENKRLMAQAVIGGMFLVLTICNTSLPQAPLLTRNEKCMTWTLSILMIVVGLLTACAAAIISVWTPPVAIGISFAATTVLMLLCSLLACYIKWDVSASGPFWLSGIVLFFFLWTLGALIYSLVTHWQGTLFFRLSLLVGANLFLAFDFMWNYQLVFGGKYERRKKIARCDWMWSSTVLSIAMLAHYLLNVLSVKWILFGLEHMGYSQ